VPAKLPSAQLLFTPMLDDTAVRVPEGSEMSWRRWPSLKRCSAGHVLHVAQRGLYRALTGSANTTTRETGLALMRAWTGARADARRLTADVRMERAIVAAGFFLSGEQLF
jgi:hypothetical protein